MRKALRDGDRRGGGGRDADPRGRGDPDGSAAGKGILFFGGYDPAYPRNAIIRKGWRECGYYAGECRVSERWKVYRRYPALAAAYVASGDPSRVLFVPDFRHKDIPLAWALARLSRKHLVFDPLVSRWETRVLDRGDVSRRSPQSWHNRNIDRMSMRLADLVLADTTEHASFYAAEFGVRPERLRVLPVGYDDAVFSAAPERAPDGRMEVLFYGTYLPLHGTAVIVEAARLMNEEPVAFTLVGEGQTRAQAESLARGLPEDAIRFLPAAPQEEIARMMRGADVVLGIFGTTRKASMVVPNKVFQSLAAGRCVVTAETPAVRELFRNSEHLVLVKAGDALSLAQALRGLLADPGRRSRIAAAGGELVRREYRPRRIAERLHGILEEAGML